ncbi:protein kinase [Frankia sp. CN7]|uniref:Protein kinase n=1 Tax=Frankia nepalensis TaxID=1836974 RepID=A0A937RDN1_9ACTN|nr:protein kinase [Frankia nepalensis]MBL7497128.1 protein kinase [Frankia nepalensis]MBL7627070.1 protein kinase [Frankia nepalensis]
MIVDRGRIAAALPGYTLGDEIGSGSFGLVVAGWHRHLQRDVAIKVVAAGRRGKGHAGPAITEGRILASLDNPHIVRVYDHVDSDDLHLIVMERLSGGTLSDRVPELGPREACAVGLAVADALSAAHARGVLHRDIKPDNVLFDRSGMPKVVDFGIAKLIRGSAATASRVFGTPMFMAPEQFEAGRLGPYTDVYALGAVLYLLMAGHAPREYPGAEPAGTSAIPSPRQYHDRRPPGDRPHAPVGVPDAVAAVILRALDREAARRTPSARSFALDLAGAATGAYGPGWLARTGIPVRLADEVRAAAERPDAFAGIATARFITVAARASTAVPADDPAVGPDRAKLNGDGDPEPEENPAGPTAGSSAHEAAPAGPDGLPPPAGGRQGRRGGLHRRPNPRPGAPARTWSRPRYRYVAAAVAVLIAATTGSALALSGGDLPGAAGQLPTPSPPPATGATVASAPPTASAASAAPPSPPSADEIRPRLLGAPLPTGTDWATSAIFSPSSPILITANRDGSLRQWNIEDPARPRALDERLTVNGLAGVALSPDGRILAASTRARASDLPDVGPPSLRLWDTSVPGVLRLLGSVPAHLDTVISVAFHPRRHLLATSSWDKTVQLWDVSNPRLPVPLGTPLTGHTHWVFPVAFSADGNLLASGSIDGTVRLWDVSNPLLPRPVGRPLAGHSAGAYSLAFAPNGRVLASGATDGTIRLWDVSDPANVRPLGAPITEHYDRVWNLAFSPGGDVLASASADLTARLWDVHDPANPRRIGEPLSHPDIVMAVSFSADGRHLATASWDHMVRLWSLA